MAPIFEERNEFLHVVMMDRVPCCEMTRVLKFDENCLYIETCLSLLGNLRT